MAEFRLGELFAQFEAQVSGTFRPLPLARVLGDARRRRRRRRVWHGFLAALLAGLVGAPVGALTLADRHHRPPPPPVFPTPTGAWWTNFHADLRPVKVPDVVDLSVLGVWMVDDAQHGWALLGLCPQNRCRYALATTADGGLTWRHTAALPDLRAPVEQIRFYPLDARTATVHEVGHPFWLTTDRGATFSAYPAGQPPAAAQQAATAPLPGGRFGLRCAGAPSLDDPPSACPRGEVVRIGAGPAPTRPSLPGQLAQVVSGGDGRLWVTSRDGDRTHVAWSGDDAGTWTELPTLPAAARLTASPDGRDVWLVGDETGKLWHVVGSAFAPEKGLPENTGAARAVAVGGGLLAVGLDSGEVGFWGDGVYTPVARYPAFTVQALPDGTAVFHTSPKGRLVASGTGRERTWFWLT